MDVLLFVGSWVGVEDRWHEPGGGSGMGDGEGASLDCSLCCLEPVLSWNGCSMTSTSSSNSFSVVVAFGKLLEK